MKLGTRAGTAPLGNAPTRAQVLLARAALSEGSEGLAAWRSWKTRNSLEGADAESRALLPLLYRNLLVLDPGEPALPLLRGVYRQAWLKNQHQFRGAGEAIRSLSNAGFETLVFKGAALMVQSYRDRGLRPMVDVDVLVRTDQALAAAQHLTEAGWRAVGTSLARQMPVVPGTLFVDGSGGGVIDLHWHSLWAPAQEDDFWGAALPIEIGGAPTLGQCSADQLLQVCVHGVWARARQPVRWLADAMMVLDGAGVGFDWERVIERARARSLTLPMAAALRYLRQVMAAPIPSEVVRALESTARRYGESAVHWAWTGEPTRARTAVVLADNYRRRRALAPSAARPESIGAYIAAYAQVSWGVERRRDIAVVGTQRLLRRELAAR